MQVDKVKLKNFECMKNFDKTRDIKKAQKDREAIIKERDELQRLQKDYDDKYSYQESISSKNYGRTREQAEEE
jgi:hypothetical protein